MAYTFTRTGAQIEEIHNTVEDPKSNTQFSDDIRTIAGEYRGLWPDTGGSANKGDTWQTQVGGVPTGEYFTALQNTTDDPVGDDVNWRLINSATTISTKTSESAQDFIDSFALKIFQSPTDGGLTEIQTRTVNANEAYEVRKTSDDSLATIYSDAAGTTEIVQNGTSNVSDSSGVVAFYIADGVYRISTIGVSSGFSVAHLQPFETVTDMKAANGLTDGQKVFLSEGDRSGDFMYLSGDFTAQVSNDTLEGIYVALDGDPTGANGVLKRILTGYITPEFFGAEGTIETDSPAIVACANYPGAPVHMDGGKTYLFDAINYNLNGLLNKVFIGNGCTFRVVGGDIPVKSPVNSKFKQVNFVGDRTGRQRIWVSNYTNVEFNECSFRGFCNSTLQEDTYALMMYAGDVDTNITASGNSSGGRIVKCDFDGERITMFGVRIYTDFNVIGTATNTDTWVIGGNYDQFMWNAVEIAGPNTIGCGVTGWATAYNNGLTPFDIDKGAKNCVVENVIIDRITGLPAPYGENSRPSIVNIQGYSPTGIYSHGNTVRNVIATLYKSDMDAVIGRGSAIATMAWSSGDDKIENVQVEVIGGQPVSAVAGKMGLALLVFQDIGGCTVSEIRTSHASHGIVESGTTGDGGSERKNYFSGFSSVNSIEGEAVCIAEGSTDKRQFIISDIDFYSTKTAPFKLNGTVLNLQAANANTYIDISESNIGVNSGFVVTALAPKIGFRKLFIYNRDGSQNQMFQSVNSLTWLNLSDVIYNSEPIFCDAALTSVSGSYTISTQKQHSKFDRFGKVNGSDLWVFSGAPANPVAENWPISQRLRKQTFTDSSGYELIKLGNTWRSVGQLLPE